MKDNLGAKLPGKTEFSGRRRLTTRKSGFKSHPDSTGGEFKTDRGQAYAVRAGEALSITFAIPGHAASEFLGFGGYFLSDGNVTLAVEGFEGRSVQTRYGPEAWNKFGSFWVATDPAGVEVKVKIRSKKDVSVALYGCQCGVVRHQHLSEARRELLPNMYQFVPETLFIAEAGRVTIAYDSGREISPLETGKAIQLKSCNRCARFLPINVGGKRGQNERHHLSFTNHCVAAHRRPCTHTGFGVLTEPDTGRVLRLEYGFQLECRFCKKFEVNAVLNPKRTAAQMKEDAARRRFFELLLTELYGGSAQLRYRHDHGTELTDDVYNRFEGRCFKCSYRFETINEMHLDHTRPLALLWPLDGTATALCSDHNTEKRDRPPAAYYDAVELGRLSQITGIPIEELEDPTPNMKAIELLLGRLDWFFDKFLMRPEMTEERDGKITGELLVKALQKVLNGCPRGAPVDLVGIYHKRRKE